MILSRRNRFVAGGLLLCAGYLPLINSVFFNKPLIKPSENYTSVELTDFSDKVALSDFLFNIGSYDNFDDSFYACCNFSDKSNSLDELVTLLTKIHRVSNFENSASVLVSKQKSVSPIKIINVGEYADARVVKSIIKSNFYADARRLGVPATVVDSVIRILSEKINFSRSLKVGDKFEILYSKNNKMLYSRITTKKNDISTYRFADGKSSSYYFANGVKSRLSANARNNSFSQPLNGKLSASGKFGYRRHPVTGQYHNHSGVDLRASYGSSVLAIYDGVVTRASYYAGYGHCIDIQHTSGYSSRYGHLSKYAVKVGSKVRRGQVIGKSGSSGVSTGPHLHLELAKNKVAVNPFSVKMIPTEKAYVREKSEFNALKSKIGNVFNKI